VVVGRVDVGVAPAPGVVGDRVVHERGELTERVGRRPHGRRDRVLTTGVGADVLRTPTCGGNRSLDRRTAVLGAAGEGHGCALWGQQLLAALADPPRAPGDEGYLSVESHQPHTSRRTPNT